MWPIACVPTIRRMCGCGAPRPVYSAGGEDFPNAPPSAALILAGGMPTMNRNAKVAEFEIDGAGMAVIGIEDGANRG